MIFVFCLNSEQTSLYVGSADFMCRDEWREQSGGGGVLCATQSALNLEQTQCQSLHLHRERKRADGRIFQLNWILCARAAQQTTGGWSWLSSSVSLLQPPLGDSAQLLFAHQQLTNASSCVRNGISISQNDSVDESVPLHERDTQSCSLQPSCTRRAACENKQRLLYSHVQHLTGRDKFEVLEFTVTLAVKNIMEIDFFNR